ncbi:hypothetical protein E2C01_034412 [Portunus trituberculatus]|uniref:Uncharacterized protein n=1 Tax=Portunus trituberculatus TaxID=210409 RepID=A0A5B7F0K5_PORTR|nr:hypothetical protein [Portunus trituberculatus]
MTDRVTGCRSSAYTRFIHVQSRGCGLLPQKAVFYDIRYRKYRRKISRYRYRYRYPKIGPIPPIPIPTPMHRYISTTQPT